MLKYRENIKASKKKMNIEREIVSERGVWGSVEREGSSVETGVYVIRGY